MARHMFLLGVLKKKPIKRNKQKLLNKVLDYLLSDSYMFAPLISRPPSVFSSSQSSIKKKAIVRGMEVKKPIRKKKKLFKKVVEYMKSNSYMYAPLLAGPQSITKPSKGFSHLEEVTTVEISKRKTFLKSCQSNKKLTDVIVEDKASKGLLPEKVISKHESSVLIGKVKHIVPNTRRPSMPGLIL